MCGYFLPLPDASGTCEADAGIDVILGYAVLDPSVRAILVTLCMAVLSPIMAEVGGGLPEGE